jgi:hypothetical protein
MARSYTVSMIKVLVGVAQQKSAPPAARVMAANSILDRGWGKAEQTHAVSDVTLQVVVRQIIDIAPQSDSQNALIDVTPDKSTDV